MYKQAKENLCVSELTVLGDKGYFSAEQLAAAEKDGIVSIVSKPDSCYTPDPKYTSANFIYNEQQDCYICPEGNSLPRKNKKDKETPEIYYGSNQICEDCPVKGNCTLSKNGRTIVRQKYQDAADRTFLKVYENRSLYKKTKNTC